MIDDITVQHVVLAAKKIIESENRHNFDIYAVDDSEHIPRMARIADAVRDFFEALGVPPERSDAIANDLLDYARQVYVDEWMRPQSEEESPPRKEDAIRSFNKYLDRRKRRTRS